MRLLTLIKHNESASLIGRLGSSAFRLSTVACRCRSRARAPLRNWHPDFRRLLAEVAANEQALRATQAELEARLAAAPASNWQEAADKAAIFLPSSVARWSHRTQGDNSSSPPCSRTSTGSLARDRAFSCAARLSTRGCHGDTQCPTSIIYPAETLSGLASLRCAHEKA